MKDPVRAKEFWRKFLSGMVLAGLSDRSKDAALGALDISLGFLLLLLLLLASFMVTSSSWDCGGGD